MTMAVKILIVRWVDDEPQPGIVECKLIDRFGKEWTFIEKSMVVSAADLWNDSVYPQPGVIACSVLSRDIDEQGREFAVIDSEKPWHIEAVDGETGFEIFADQLTSFG